MIVKDMPPGSNLVRCSALSTNGQAQVKTAICIKDDSSNKCDREHRWFSRIRSAGEIHGILDDLSAFWVDGSHFFVWQFRHVLSLYCVFTLIGTMKSEIIFREPRDRSCVPTIYKDTVKQNYRLLCIAMINYCASASYNSRLWQARLKLVIY